jgi:ParB family chromosome partitioning protein
MEAGMAEQDGHIELHRTVDSIVIGHRHREDLGDIDALARSIERLGLLQPVTITPDGFLVCGRRRLEAVKRLGWRTLKVWVRSGISDELSRLLAERDENEQRKDLDEVEQARLYEEISLLLAEDAARRQAATRFGSLADPGGSCGGGDSPPPDEQVAKTRDQAARIVTGRASYHRHEQVNEIQRIADDDATPPTARQTAQRELAAIKAGAKVNGAYQRVTQAMDLASLSPIGTTPPAELERLAENALARAKKQRTETARTTKRQSIQARGTRRSVRAFLLTWSDLDGWSRYYNPTEIASQLKDSDWQMFERVLAETITFAEAVREIRSTVTGCVRPC